MPRTHVSFANAAGATLAGILETPDGAPPRATALFAHCFTCTKNLRAAARISGALAARGIAVLRFDFTGLGESEGDFGSSGISANVADLVAAAGYLQEHLAAPALLVGHSLGGTAALMAAGELASCTAVATIGSPAHASHVTRHFEDSLDSLREQGSARVNIGGRSFRLRREFLDDLESQAVTPRIAKLDRALLVLHSPVDTVVSIDNASEIFLAARHPKSFVSLDQADHLLSEDRDAEYAAAIIAAWAAPYLPAADNAMESAAGQPGTVTASTGAEGFRTPLQAGRHALLADEPESAGGDDAGPSPYDLLAAALASCTSMTLQMYARHKELPLERATVSVTHRRVHARDCEDCDSREGRIDEFRRELGLDGPLSADQRQRMLEIADKCPVHRTLHGEVKVRTRLREDA